MHPFSDLADRCATSTLEALRETSERTSEALQTSGATALVKALQMVPLQKAILAVGMFSMFEANLQDGLKCQNGFAEAARILERQGEAALAERFDNLRDAINVLKHGRGRSYNALIAKASSLPFRVKMPDYVPFEGDLSEISPLVEVDDAFVLLCSDLIREVSGAIRKTYPDYLG